MVLRHLRHKELEGLTFGPESEIVFGLKGGFAPGEVIIDDADPLYRELWDREGAQLEEITEGPAKVYVSPINPAVEYPSRGALMAGIRREAANGDVLAAAWLQRNGDIDDDPEEQLEQLTAVGVPTAPPRFDILPTQPAFGDPAANTGSTVAEAAEATGPAKRRTTRRSKSRKAASPRGAARHATRQGGVVASPAPLPPAGPLPPGGV